MSTDVAREKAARLLKKRGSISSVASSEVGRYRNRGSRSMSTVSYLDDPGQDNQLRPSVKLENTYQMDPNRKFPDSHVKAMIKDVLESYLAEEKYEPELCRQMTKTISEVIKARVKELMLPRYKIICIVHIGQLKDQAMRIGSRCLWDHGNDTYSSSEFRNNSLFAIGTVYGVYSE